MGPGIKGSSTQPCVEHRKLTRYCLASSRQVSVICRIAECGFFFFFPLFFSVTERHIRNGFISEGRQS